MAHLVETAESARELAEALTRPGRDKPVVVVSIAGGHTEPFVDVDNVESELEGLCEVYVLPTGAPSWAFAQVLPEGRQVFGGASRVYSPDLAWVADQYASPLRFAYSKADARRVSGDLVADALTVVYRTRQHAPHTPAGRVESTGVVRGVAGGRALVQLDSGGGLLPATVHPELVAPGVAAERLFVKGQRVSGLYDVGANRLDVEAGVLRPPDAFAGVASGDVLLAQVSRIGTKYVTVTLLPGVDVRIPIDDPDEDDLGPALYTLGEVLPVEVTEIADGLPAHAAVRPGNFADLAKPVAILPGGPGWISADQMGPASAEGDRAPGPPDAAADEVADFDVTAPDAPLLSEIAGLRRRLCEKEREVETLTQKVASAKTATRTAREELRSMRDQLDAARSNRPKVPPNLFADPVDQFRHEVYVAWAERTTANDKDKRPWREPALGPTFLTTLDEVEGVERSKVIEVVADIVSGHAEHLTGRALHQLRRGNGANDPVVTREDGSTCWRLYLQHKSPSARRLHFWRLPDNSIELSSVRLHDDNRP